jgi:(+)-trans-carveol dehydrogenase
MMYNDQMVDIFVPGESTKTIPADQWWDSDGLRGMHMLPTAAMEPEDITEVIMFLASRAGRFITASEIPVDLGYIMKMQG